MRGCSRFERDNGFIAVAGCFHKARAVFNAFNVQGDTRRHVVFGKVGDQVCKVKVRLVADGEHLVKTDTAGVCGGDHGDEQGTAL